jgi:hypothetical protein
MLSEDDKHRIRLEEEGKAQARAEALEQAAKTRASHEYRKQVRAELISRRRHIFAGRFRFWFSQASARTSSPDQANQKSRAAPTVLAVFETRP